MGVTLLTRGEVTTMVEQEVRARAQEFRILDAKKMLSKGLEVTLVSEITEIDVNTLKQMKDADHKN